MPCGSRRPSLHTSRERVYASVPASELSPHDILQHLTVQRQVGHNPRQPCVLVLELLQPAHLVGQQPTIPFLLGKVGRLSNTRLAKNLGNRRAFLTLLQDECLLRLRELRCLHHSQLLFQPGNASRKLQLQTVQFSGGRAPASECYLRATNAAQCNARRN